jgi:hypothetical protein
LRQEFAAIAFLFINLEDVTEDVTNLNLSDCYEYVGNADPLVNMKSVRVTHSKWVTPRYSIQNSKHVE